MDNEIYSYRRLLDGRTVLVPGCTRLPCWLGARPQHCSHARLTKPPCWAEIISCAATEHSSFRSRSTFAMGWHRCGVSTLRLPLSAVCMACQMPFVIPSSPAPLSLGAWSELVGGMRASEPRTDFYISFYLILSLFFCSFCLALLSSSPRKWRSLASSRQDSGVNGFHAAHKWPISLRPCRAHPCHHPLSPTAAQCAHKIAVTKHRPAIAQWKKYHIQICDCCENHVRVWSCLCYFKHQRVSNGQIQSF